MTEFGQQRLIEHVLNWSGLPVTHIRPTLFVDVGHAYELTGAASRDMTAIAGEFSALPGPPRHLCGRALPELAGT